MKCSEVILEISNYIDGELDVALKQELEKHLENCQECRLVVNQTKLTIEIFCEAQAVELPADVQSRLHEALRRKMSEGRT